MVSFHSFKEVIPKHKGVDGPEKDKDESVKVGELNLSI
jgi:hypothetical protein